MRKTSLSITVLVCILSMLLLLPTAASRDAGSFDSFVSSVDQYYAVSFDGEGEAIVSVVLDLTNNAKDPLEKVNLEVPGKEVTFIGAAQKTGGGYVRQCASYDSTCVEYGSGSTCVRYDYNGNCEEYQRPCLKREQTCSYYRNVYTGEETYERLSVTPEPFSESTNLPLELIHPLTEGESTKVLVMYKATGYVGPALNGNRFSFETGKVPLPTGDMRVSIDVPQDAQIKDGNSRVNYQSNTVADALGSQSFSAETSKRLAGHTEQIMRSYGYVEYEKYLDPHESVTVSGIYAKSPLRLYLGEIIVSLLAVCAVLAGLVYGIRRLVHYANEHLSSSKKKKPHGFIVPFLGGLLVSFVIVLLWCLTAFIIWALSELFLFGAFAGITAVVLIILVGLFTLLALVGVPVYIGIRYGASMGLFTALSAIGWIIVTVVFLVLGFIIIAMVA